MHATTIKARLAAAVFGLGMAFGATGAMAEMWDMPTPYPDSNFHTQNIRQFAQDVKEATGGKFDITVHSGGSLVKHPEIRRSVQSGQAQIGEVLISSWANDDPLYGLDSVPFLASDFEQARKLYQASRPALEKKLAEKRLKLLFSVPWPPQGLYVKQEIASIDDLKGQKFRVYNPGTARIAELVGAVPTKIEAAEVAQAFSTGIVQSMMTSAATGVDSKAWDFVNVYYDLQAWLPRNMVFVNEREWNKLDEATRKTILDAAAKAEARGWEGWQKKTAELNATLAKNGVKVITPSPELKQQFAKIGETIAAEWAKQAGADGEAILKVYRGQ